MSHFPPSGFHRVTLTAPQEAKDAVSAGTESGYVLVAVLWTMLIVSAIALALTLSTRSRVKTAANFAAWEEARLLADGLVELLAADWAGTAHPAASAIGLGYDGGLARCAVNANAIDVSVTSVMGLVDINAAPLPVLERLILALKVPQPFAHPLAAAIIDFRDGDDTPTPSGAELLTYLASGLGHGPKNAPFDTIGELEQVLGMRRDIFHAMRNYVTVHSRSPFIDRTVAPAELVAGLARLETTAGPIRVDMFGHAAESARIVRIVVRVETPRGVRFVRDSVVEKAPRAPLGYVLLDWSSYREDAQLDDRSTQALRSCL